MYKDLEENAPEEWQSPENHQSDEPTLEQVISHYKLWLEDFEKHVIAGCVIEWDIVQNDPDRVTKELKDIEEALTSQPINRLEEDFLTGITLIYTAPPERSEMKASIMNKVDLLQTCLENAYKCRYLLDTVRAIDSVTA